MHRRHVEPLDRLQGVVGRRDDRLVKTVLASLANALLADGVYTTNRYGKHRFQYVSAPLSDEITGLVHTISHRIACFLERQGMLERDMEQSYLTLEEDDDPMGQIQGHSITYRIAVGAQQGQKVFTLQTLPPSDNESNEAQIGQIAGFSLHAGINKKWV